MFDGKPACGEIRCYVEKEKKKSFHSGFSLDMLIFQISLFIFLEKIKPLYEEGR